MRRMMFACFLWPGTRQYVELAHPYARFAECGVTRIAASVSDAGGRGLGEVEVPLTENPSDLRELFPDVREPAMVLLDVAYNLKGRAHPYQYGFLFPESGTPIHYPLDMALGLTNAINYYPNFGYFPVAGLPRWMGLRLYLGNVGEYAPLDATVTLVSADGERTLPVRLGPLQHCAMDLPAHEPGAPLRYLTVGGEAKPVCYVAGVDARTEAITFLEHLMQVFKYDENHVETGAPPVDPARPFRGGFQRR
jgi:hypothetical protein